MQGCPTVIAFTFPGQGSQKPGMGQPWRNHPAWRCVEEISAATQRDVAALLLDADLETLTSTQNAQLATFTLSMVIDRALREAGVKPAIVAGHSLGEYSAMAAAGIASIAETAQLVVARGDAMLEAAQLRHGTMYAVLGLAPNTLEQICNEAGQGAWIANLNADGQIVVAGDPEALERVAKLAKDSGAKRALPLPVGGAFHTPYMEPASMQLRSALDNAKFNNTSVLPLVGNIDGEIRGNNTDWPAYLSAQMLSAVQWVKSTQTLLSFGVQQLIEVGPGAVLTGLAKRNAPSTNALSIATPDDLDAYLENRKA